MLTALIVTAVLQSGGGMISNSPSPQAIMVPQSAMPPIPLAVSEEPEVTSGRHELVVHWPESQPRDDYRRTFKTGEGCLKGRAAVLNEHNARTNAIAVNSSNKGVILAMVLEPPYAVCVPLD